ncbi:MAG: VOC family protein [Halobacteriales archaeon]|nr:VOC family protein [Halobacteriales archaeon]
MHDTPIRVDHVGIAVPSVADAEPTLLALGAEPLHEEPIEELTWAYYALGGASRIELIEPRGEDSFLADYLEREGPGLHHVTLEVADIDAVIAGLEAAGLTVVDRAVRDGWTEAFVSPRNPTGALFQLMEYHDDFDDGRPDGLYVGGERVDR